VLNIKTLIKIFREAINKLSAPINDLDFKDIIILNKSLIDNDNSFFNFIIFKSNRFKISTFNINVDYN
jgi:hypothetical protein